MARNCNITSPLNGAYGLGPTPAIFGNGEPNSTVVVCQAGVGNELGRGSTDSNGQWSVTIGISHKITITARTFVNPSDINSVSSWSNEITIQPN